jgi:hypothetical protein
MYDLAAVRDKFPFSHGICHEGDVVDWGTQWIWEIAVAVQLERTAYVAHEGGVPQA